MVWDVGRVPVAGPKKIDVTEVIADDQAYNSELAAYNKLCEKAQKPVSDDPLIPRRFCIFVWPQFAVRNDAADEHRKDRVFFIVSDLENDLIEKAKKLNILRENKRKLFMVQSEVDGNLAVILACFKWILQPMMCRFSISQQMEGPVDWQTLKKRRINLFNTSGPGLSKERFEKAIELFEDFSLRFLRANKERMVTRCCLICSPRASSRSSGFLREHL